MVAVSCCLTLTSPATNGHLRPLYEKHLFYQKLWLRGVYTYVVWRHQTFNFLVGEATFVIRVFVRGMTCILAYILFLKSSFTAKFSPRKGGVCYDQGHNVINLYVLST